eukprot:SM000088S23681  [mRNA]  locus=s88:29741:30937:- [translate_table: standard]
MEEPYGRVSGVMTSMVVTTSPEATLDSLFEHFEHFTGLPVCDDDGHCVGIVSNIDIHKYARGKGGFNGIAKTKVSEIMTAPAFVILDHAPVAYAAGLMLKHKVHRLPVVDKHGAVVGIVTRNDLFEPLIPQSSPLYHRLVGTTRGVPTADF